MGTSDSVADRLWAASRLGLAEKLRVALNQGGSDILELKDSQGRTALHHAASSGYEECIEQLLCRGSSCVARDNNGDTPLHLAAKAGLPMASYQVCSRDPDTCLVSNAAGQTPVDLAASTSRGEVLNAMLLACSGSNSDAALSAMRALLGRGAVCDTWAPSGSSALMLTSSADSEEGVRLLLEHGATLELQDALGRTALMFAAGNGAAGATRALLDGGACLSARDRRGRGVLDYAGPGTAVRALLEARLAELESKSAALQAALLAEESRDGAGPLVGGKKKAGKKKKKGKSGAGASSAARPAAAAERPPVKESSRSSSSASSSCTVVIKKDDEADVAAEVDHVDEDEDAACETPCRAPSDQGRQVPPDRELEKAPSHPLARSPSPDWQVVGASRGKEPRGASGRPAPIEARRPRGRVLSRPVSGQGSATPTASAAGARASSLSSLASCSSSSDCVPGDGPEDERPRPMATAGVAPRAGLESDGAAAQAQGQAQGAGAVAIAAAPVPVAPPPPRPSVAPWAAAPELKSAPPRVAPQAHAPDAELAALCQRVRALELELEEARRAQTAELARAREEAAAAQATAVREAVEATRSDCVVRFASFLQSYGLTSLPAVLAAGGHGLSGFSFAGAEAEAALPRLDVSRLLDGAEPSPAGGTPSPPTFGEAEARGRGGFGPPVCGPYAGAASRGLGNFPPGYDGSRPAFGEDPAPDSGAPGSGRASSTVFTLNLGTTC